MRFKARHLMYVIFVGVSLIPAVLILYTYMCKVTGTSTGLLISGATQLAFGFYAFTSGIGTYTLCPQLGDKKFTTIRKDGIEKAKKTIRAARIIIIGALLLIIGGIVEPYIIPNIILLILAIPAPIILGAGAYSLSKNISYPVNTFIITRDPNTYPDKD